MAPIGAARANLSRVPSFIPDSVIDHFEESLYEDQGKTLSDYYGGEVSDFQRQTSTVYEGSYALEPTTGDTAISDDGGDFNLSDGLIYEFYTYHTSTDADGGWLWFTQNENGRSGLSGYEFNVRSNNNDIRVLRWDTGSNTTLSSTGVTIPQDEWLRGEVDHQSDGSITITLFDSSDTQLAQTSGSDTTYTSGGHGFENFNTDLIYDNVRKV